jgi:hypothetical protein
VALLESVLLEAIVLDAGVGRPKQVEDLLAVGARILLLIWLLDILGLYGRLGGLGQGLERGWGTRGLWDVDREPLVGRLGIGLRVVRRRLAEYLVLDLLRRRHCRAPLEQRRERYETGGQVVVKARFARPSRD